MLDSDVAMLYHYETKRINETVQRNKARFPENFCFIPQIKFFSDMSCRQPKSPTCRRAADGALITEKSYWLAASASAESS